eukprot:357953_1
MAEKSHYLQCESISKCRRLANIIDILKIYQKLDVENNEKDKMQLVNLCQQQYVSVLDEYIHILQKHNNENDLDKILDLMSNKHNFRECTLNNCVLATRYHRDRRNQSHFNKDNDKYVEFYRNLIDQIHCFLFHLYDTGLRVSNKDKMSNNVYDETNWVDNTFANLCNAVNVRKKAVMKIEGSATVVKNKFSILCSQNASDETLLDSLFEFIEEISVTAPPARVPIANTAPISNTSPPSIGAPPPIGVPPIGAPPIGAPPPISLGAPPPLLKKKEKPTGRAPAKGITMRGVKWNKLTDRMLYQSLFSDIEINHEDIKLDFKLLDVLWGDSTNSKFVNETVTSSNVAEPAISNRKDKSSGCITVDQLQMFQKTLHGEEYDSESIEFDVEGNRSESNIFMIHRPFYDTIKKFIHYNKLHGNTFNVGYRFYYWKYYEQVVDIQQSQNNQNDHGGYKVSELFVKTKYKNIKDEILNNQIYTLNSVELDQSLTKADQYINTERVKETIASPHRSDATIFKYSRAEDIDRDKTLHYGIIKGTSLTYEHILCVIFYTDWSELSRQFSSTFRKAKIYQSLSTVKRKNSEFAIWSKLLREVVEIFGYSSIGEQIDYNKNKWINKLQGPFFLWNGFCNGNT